MIITDQKDDHFMEKIRANVGTEKIKSDKEFMLKGRLCVPKDEGLRKEITTEVHSAPYAAHPDSTKMYRDLRNTFWWRNIKERIYLFVTKCIVCQQVKAEYQRLSGLLNPMSIPAWKWEKILMDF